MADISILITRPKGDEEELTEKLHAQDFRVIHEPMTEIFLRHDARPIQHALLSDPHAILVTSRHGVQALALLTELRDVFLLCVGEATAQMAASLGFTHVSAGSGTVASLVDHIQQGYEAGSRFLYISGDHVRADLTALLPEMVVQRIVAYEALACTELSDTLSEQLRRGQIDGITFLSQRTASIFVTLLTKAALRDATSRIRVICLSDAVTAPLRAHHWKGLHVASEPTLASLVQCVDNAFSKQRDGKNA